MINKPFEIAGREWEHIKHSLEMCGDIGEFNPKDLATSKLRAGQEYEGFILNMSEMDKKLSRYGYATPEALNVFTVLASRAAEKLGLKEGLASAFGMGYGFVRTGLLAYHTLDPRHILFNKMFFPFGGITFPWDFNYDVYPSLVKTKLRFVFERFKSWQNNPLLYTEDFGRFQSIEETWKEWEEVNE